METIIETIIDKVSDFFLTWKPTAVIKEVIELPQSGSDRMYFRVILEDNSYIITYNENVQENRTFIEFSTHFSTKNLPAPQIYFVSEDSKYYIQSDLGNTSLFQLLQKEGHSPKIYNHYKNTLSQLAKLQIEGGKGLNYEHCIATKSFDRKAIYADLLYFKYYFLRTLKLTYDKNRLLNDFEMFGYFLMQEKNKYFLMRDCQSRNVMIDNDTTYFIDYQGGMKGALQYDLASMLWQAKANLPIEWKDDLANHYFENANQLLDGKLVKDEFFDNYHGFILVRMLQTLGAYGFRGLFERKPHFLTSIPFALKNLKWFLENKPFPVRLPELQKVLKEMVSDEVIARFKNEQATEESKLVVKVCSFSYKKGLPQDETGNGGGFMFDCRGILNPGRFQPYKKLTGRDKPVQDFLLYQSEMPAFIQFVTSTIDISVNDYLKRGFDSLMISFGCTGGQHRSVFAADTIAKHLEQKFNVKVELKHLVQDAKNWKND